MSHLVIASSEADAEAAEAVVQHHAQMAGVLAVAVERLVTAASRRDETSGAAARDALVEWCRTELVPHARAEEAALYPAARGTLEGRLLVEGMLAEHAVIVALVDEIADAPDLVRSAAAARSLEVLFGSHLSKENELVVPLLTAAPDVSVADLLGGMHELLGYDDAAHAPGHGGEEAGCGGHSCTCGEVDGPGYPELDARVVPHAIRHATIFGALDAVPAGSGLVLVAPHDPLPLLGQIEQRSPGVFSVEYLERGPEAWRLQLVRRTS